MNIKPPELTIFQGMPSLYIDNTKMRPEEEEAIQDQARRNKELQVELEEQFNQLSDFEDDDPNDTTQHSSYAHQNSHQKSNGFTRDFPLRNEASGLQNLLDSKTREVDHLTNLISIERKQHKTEVDEYEKRIAIADAEKERALMNRNQTHELLVEHKHKIIQMGDENQALKSTIKSYEQENEKLVAELESTKLLLSDVQTKYNMVEKNVIFNAEKNTDQILKQAQERHSAQITMMQQQIDGLKHKYDDLQHEHKHLDIRYKELQRSREAMLIEKSETINHLNRNVEDSQRQVQELLSRPDMTQENRRLQNALRTVEYQKDELSQSKDKIQKKLQEKSSELELMDSIIQEFDANNASFTEMTKFTQFNNKDLLKSSNASTPMSPEIRLTKVKEELCKSLSNIKMKRQEIKILEQQLTEKDKEITELRRDESKNLIELNKYRDEMMRLESKISIIQSELDKAVMAVPQSEVDINLQNDLKDKLEIKKVECDDLRMEMEKLSLVDKSKNLEKENEILINELIELKKKIAIESSTACQTCEEYLTKINKMDLSSLQLQNINAEYLTEVSNLRADLANAQQTIESYERNINLQNLRDQEIEKLQNKAKQFEDFMRSNIRFDTSTSSPVASQNSSEIAHKVDASTTTEPSSDEQAHNLNLMEIKVRDEMARIFANQISMLEKKFTTEVKKMQTHNLQLSNELDDKTSNLQVIIEQLEMLKFTIVSEREEFKALLDQKDSNIEHYRKQVEDLNDKVEIIFEERDSIENLKRQIEDERKALSEKEEATLQKLKQLQEESQKIIEELNEKYKSAKKTAQNYKQYSDDKEKHYRKECERIKNGYAEAMEKIQNRLKDTLQEKDKTYNEKLKAVTQEYEFKIEVLKGMLEKAQK